MGSKSRKDKYARAGPMEANVDKMEAQLKLWARQIDVLAARPGKTGAKVRIEYLQNIDELKLRRAVAQVKVDEFKAAGIGKWEKLKGGIELAWSDLEAAFRDMKL